MKFQYVVILRKNSEKPVDLISILLCIASAAIFILKALVTDFSSSYPFYCFAALIFVGLAINAAAGRRNTKPVNYKYLLLFTGFAWLVLMPPVIRWMGLVFGVLAFLEQQTKRPLEIGFDSDRVVINTLIRRRLDWAAFNNVILRNGLLTLDFKNNRLLQREIADDDDDDEVDEEEFNAYCRQQLIAVGNELPGEAYGK